VRALAREMAPEIKEPWPADKVERWRIDRLTIFSDCF
jgi:hypothetical protein